MSTHDLQKLTMYINGEWVEPSSGQYIETIDPFTAKPWALVPRGNAEDADRAIQAAHRAFTNGPWRKLHPSERGRIIQRFADLIEQHADELAEIEVRDNGRLLAEMRHQIRYIPRWYHYYAGLADKIEGAVHPCDKKALSFSRHEPLGVCVGIVPWQRNFNLGSDVTQSMMLLLCGFQACDFAPHFGSGVS